MERKLENFKVKVSEVDWKCIVFKIVYIVVVTSKIRQKIEKIIYIEKNKVIYININKCAYVRN